MIAIETVPQPHQRFEVPTAAMEPVQSVTTIIDRVIMTEDDFEDAMDVAVIDARIGELEISADSLFALQSPP